MSNQTIENEVEINRICTLQVGDSFLYDGYWRTVTEFKGDSIRFKTTFGDTYYRNIGRKSQLFVQISRAVQPKTEEE